MRSTFTTLIPSRERPPQSPKIDRHARGKGSKGGGHSLTPLPFVLWGGRGLFRGGMQLPGQVGGACGIHGHPGDRGGGK